MLDQYKKNIPKSIISLIAILLISLMTATLADAANTSMLVKTELNKPIYSDNHITKWSEEAVLSVYNYDYKNYQQKLESASGYFTKTGWDNFMKALKTSENLDAVKANKMNITATMEKAKIVSQSVVKGIYTWNIQAPIKVSYHGNAKDMQQSYVANLVVVRTNSGEGLAIDQLNINQ